MSLQRIEVSDSAAVTGFCNGERTAMSDAKVRGVVHFIDQTKTYGQKGFRKRVVVLAQDNGRFTNYVPLDFTQDGCDRADQLEVGDEVEVQYRLSGRKWQKDAASEVKYFLSNPPPRTALQTLLDVAFTRANVEHVFRVAKSEIGFSHFEGRNYVGLLRHLILCQLVMTFVAEQTDRLRGEKRRDHPRTSRTGPEHGVPPMARTGLSALAR